MKRWLFNFTAGASALLCVSLVVLRAQTHWYIDVISLGRPGDRSIRIAAVDGLLSIYQNRLLPALPGLRQPSGIFRLVRYTNPSGRQLMFYSPTTGSFFGDINFEETLWGFGLLHVTGPVEVKSGTTRSVSTQSHWQVTIPLWFLAVISLITPTFWLIRHRRTAHRLRNQRCVACGYDLRATPDRCPECGAIAAA